MLYINPLTNLVVCINPLTTDLFINSFTVYPWTGDVVMDMDEHPRPQTTPEQMAKLPPVFKKGGTVNAANASVCIQV